MTVASTTNKSGPYNGNGSTANFAVNFKYTNTNEVSVIVTSSAGVETTKVLDTHYTLTPAGDSGTVSFITAPTDHRPQSGETVTIVGVLPVTQATDLTSGGSFAANTIEGAFDKLTRLVQQIAEKVTRAPKLRVTTTTGEVGLPEPAAGSVLVWNDAATDLENKAPADIDLAVVSPYIETLLDDTDAATARDTLGVTIGEDVQAWDADLDDIAALSTTSYGRSLLTLADDDALAAQVDSFFLTPAEADALFLTPAEGEALFLTPAEGDAAYQPLGVDLVLFDGVGDDTTDDGPALQTALDAADGRTVRLIPGKTYRIATAVVTRGKSWTLDARGAKIHIDANVHGLTAYADIDNLQDVSSISGTDVTVDDGSAFSVGDHVRVISEDTPVNARTVASGNPYRGGEPCIVASIAGDVLTMTNSLIHGASLVTNPRIFRIPLEEQVRIVGGEWYYTEGHDATPWTSNMIMLFGLISPRVEGVRITRGYSNGLALWGTQHAYVSGLRAERLTDNTGNGQFGYGLSDGGYGTTCVGISGGNCRHLVTTNTLTVPALTTSEDQLHRYGGSRGLRVIGGTCWGSSAAAFDTHHQTEDVVFSDIYAENCTQAVAIRAQKARVTNVEGRNCTEIVFVFSDNYVDGVSDGPATEDGWAHDVYIDNVFGNGEKALRVLKAKNVHVGRVKAHMTAWKAFDIIDAEVFLHGDINLTIDDDTATYAGRGIFDVDQSQALFTPQLEQYAGKARVSASASSGSTSFAAVRSDGSAVTFRDLSVVFPSGSVGPMLVTANSGTLAADIFFDISGSAETGMSLTSGTGITANVQSSDGLNDAASLRSKARAGTKFVSVGPVQSTTIASGAITVSGSLMFVDTESSAASDDLTTINGGVLGDMVVLRAANTARTVVVKHGTGNIFCGSDRTLDNTLDLITLVNTNGTSWVMTSFADNGA